LAPGFAFGSLVSSSVFFTLRMTLRIGFSRYGSQLLGMTIVLEGEHVPKHDASPKGEARRGCAAKEERSDDAEGGLRWGWAGGYY
jgi:hypothetical protein